MCYFEFYFMSDAFNKYDYTGDGRLAFKEFTESWRDLGLKASGEELRDAFNQLLPNKEFGGNIYFRPSVQIGMELHFPCSLRRNIIFIGATTLSL